MSNIKITIDGVEKEYYVIPTYKHDEENDTFFRGDWYREVEPVKQGYEILSFGDTTYGGFCNKIENGVYKWDIYGYEYNLEFLLDIRRSYFIHSVKRLSDDLIVTVDNIFPEYGKVNAITIDKDGWGITVHFNKGEYLLSGLDAEKVKQPTILLTTEDGKEITDGYQKVYGVSDYFITISTKARNAGASIYKYFSTEAARDEYILYNKPITVTIKEYLASNLSPVIFLKSKQN